MVVKFVLKMTGLQDIVIFVDDFYLKKQYKSL